MGENQFREIFEKSPIGIIFHDKKGKITDINQSALEIVGAPSLDAVRDVNLFDNPEIISRKEELLNKGLIKFQASVDFKDIKKNELYTPKHIGTVFIDYTVSVTDSGYLLQIQDITEYEIAEKTLKESERRYKQFFNNPLNGFALCEIITENKGKPVDFVYLEVNKAFENFTGLKKEEIVNKKATELFPYEEIADLIQIYGKVALTEDSTIFQYPMPFLDKYYEVAAFSPQKKQFIAFFKDITKRKKAEEALRDSEERYRSIIDNLQDAYFRGDKKGKIIMASPSAAQMYGYDSPQEMIGLHTISIYKNKEDRVFVLKELNKYGKLEDNEVESLRKDGTSFWVSQNAQFYYDKKGKIQGTEAFVRDITERKHLEKELMHAYDNLELKVEERTAEVEMAYNDLKENEIKLKEAISALERSNLELQSFAYITSHDLQEPLRTVASFTQLLQRRYEGKLDSDADEFMDYIVDASKRMKDMIQGLLEYSRVDNAEKEFTETNMNVNVEKAVSNLHVAIKESKAIITHDPLPSVYADPDQMVRVFQNFIGNAIKFKNPNLPPKIHIKAINDKRKKEWIFSIKDNGIGIESQYTAKIFEVFKRLHTIDEYNGTGIGLAIIKKIIERHSGRIWVESQFNKGSTFYFTIPFQ